MENGKLFYDVPQVFVVWGLFFESLPIFFLESLPLISQRQ